MEALTKVVDTYSGMEANEEGAEEIWSAVHTLAQKELSPAQLKKASLALSRVHQFNACLHKYFGKGLASVKDLTVRARAFALRAALKKDLVWETHACEQIGKLALFRSAPAECLWIRVFTKLPREYQLEECLKLVETRSLQLKWENGDALRKCLQGNPSLLLRVALGMNGAHELDIPKLIGHGLERLPEDHTWEEFDKLLYARIKADPEAFACISGKLLNYAQARRFFKLFQLVVPLHKGQRAKKQIKRGYQTWEKALIPLCNKQLKGPTLERTLRGCCDYLLHQERLNQVQQLLAGAFTHESVPEPLALELVTEVFGQLKAETPVEHYLYCLLLLRRRESEASAQLLGELLVDAMNRDTPLQDEQILTLVLFKSERTKGARGQIFAKLIEGHSQAQRLTNAGFASSLGVDLTEHLTQLERASVEGKPEGVPMLEAIYETHLLLGELITVVGDGPRAPTSLEDAKRLEAKIKAHRAKCATLIPHLPAGSTSLHQIDLYLVQLQARCGDPERLEVALASLEQLSELGPEVRDDLLTNSFGACLWATKEAAGVRKILEMAIGTGATARSSVVTHTLFSTAFATQVTRGSEGAKGFGQLWTWCLECKFIRPQEATSFFIPWMEACPSGKQVRKSFLNAQWKALASVEGYAQAGHTLLEKAIECEFLPEEQLHAAFEPYAKSFPLPKLTVNWRPFQSAVKKRKWPQATRALREVLKTLPLRPCDALPEEAIATLIPHLKDLSLVANLKVRLGSSHRKIAAPLTKLRDAQWKACKSLPAIARFLHAFPEHESAQKAFVEALRKFKGDLPLADRDAICLAYCGLPKSRLKPGAHAGFKRVADAQKVSLRWRVGGLANAAWALKDRKDTKVVVDDLQHAFELILKADQAAEQVRPALRLLLTGLGELSVQEKLGDATDLLDQLLKEAVEGPCLKPLLQAAGGSGIFHDIWAFNVVAHLAREDELEQAVQAFHSVSVLSEREGNGRLRFEATGTLLLRLAEAGKLDELRQSLCACIDGNYWNAPSMECNLLVVGMAKALVQADCAAEAMEIWALLGDHQACPLSASLLFDASPDAKVTQLGLAIDLMGPHTTDPQWERYLKAVTADPTVPHVSQALRLVLAAQMQGIEKQIERLELLHTQAPDLVAGRAEAAIALGLLPKTLEFDSKDAHLKAGAKLLQEMLYALSAETLPANLKERYQAWCERRNRECEWQTSLFQQQCCVYARLELISGEEESDARARAIFEGLLEAWKAGQWVAEKEHLRMLLVPIILSDPKQMEALILKAHSCQLYSGAIAAWETDVQQLFIHVRKPADIANLYCLLLKHDLYPVLKLMDLVICLQPTFPHMDSQERYKAFKNMLLLPQLDNLLKVNAKERSKEMGTLVVKLGSLLWRLIQRVPMTVKEMGELNKVYLAPFVGKAQIPDFVKLIIR